MSIRPQNPIAQNPIASCPPLRPGDIIGLHQDNASGHDPRATYVVVAIPDPARPELAEVNNADPTAPRALDWAGTITTTDVAWLCRRAANRLHALWPLAPVSGDAR